MRFTEHALSWTLVVFLFATSLIAGLGYAQLDVAQTSSLGVEGVKKLNETSGVGSELGRLPAAELISLCFAEESERINQTAGWAPDLERLDTPGEDVDILTLARYTLRNIFLNPSKPINSTLVVPLRDEILACGPDTDSALASIKVISACRTDLDNPQEDVVFLIQWEATLTCTNRVGVMRGSVLDVMVGSVLRVSESTPIQVERLFLIPKQFPV